jgi:hypothetical protein
MTVGRGNRSTGRKSIPSAMLSIKNPTLPDLGSNPGNRGERPVTNRLSSGTGYFMLKSTNRMNFNVYIFLNNNSIQKHCVKWKKHRPECGDYGHLGYGSAQFRTSSHSAP